MENIPEGKKVAVINPQKRIKDKKRQAAAICAVPVLFVVRLAAHVLLWTLSESAF